MFFLSLFLTHFPALLQPIFTCSKSGIKTLEKGVEYNSKLTIKIPEAEKTWRENFFSTIVVVKFTIFLPLGILPLLLKNIAIDFVGKIACIQQAFVRKHFLNRGFIE